SFNFEKAHYFVTIMGISEEDIKFSNGWLNGFKQRNNLKVHKIHKEANDALLELLPNMRAKLRTLIAKYRPEDVFNTDETGREPNEYSSSNSKTDDTDISYSETDNMNIGDSSYKYSISYDVIIIDGISLFSYSYDISSSHNRSISPSNDNCN
ncbi:14388_t:CDS:2, partial [Racocetra persica]